MHGVSALRVHCALFASPDTSATAAEPGHTSPSRKYFSALLRDALSCRLYFLFTSSELPSIPTRPAAGSTRWLLGVTAVTQLALLSQEVPLPTRSAAGANAQLHFATQTSV